MNRLTIAMLASLLVLACGISAHAEPPRANPPRPAHDDDWRGIARKHGLSPQEIDQLAKTKLLVINQAFKQVFAPYIELALTSDLPPFITSDSLLNAFHVLYEESVLRLEQANARRLSNILKFIWKNIETADKLLTGGRELVAGAKTRAKLMIAVALQLLGEEPWAWSHRLPQSSRRK